MNAGNVSHTVQTAKDDVIIIISINMRNHVLCIITTASIIIVEHYGVLIVTR